MSGSITTQSDVTIPGGNNGSITVAGSGGTPPYQYQLGSGALQASGTFGTLTAGTYTVMVQDNNGCTAPVPVTITQPAAALSATATPTNVSCFGSSNGSITATGTGGVPPYDYSLDGVTFQVSGTFGSLAAGTYTVTVRDAALTTFDVPVTITQPASLVSGSVSSQTNVLCFGSTTGSVTVAGSGGTPPYQYKLGSGAYQASDTFSTLGAGTYTVTVQDANNCSAVVSVTITQPVAAITLSNTTTNVLCAGSTNGSISVTAAGGTSPYTFSLNGGTSQINGAFSNLAAAIYTVTVLDANLCPASTQITITEPEAVSIASTSTNASCPGEADGAISLTITGGSQPYKVIWADGILTQDRQKLTDGTYSVVVTDINGCSAKSLDVVVGVTGSEKCLEIPDIITPNNDGFNDTWKIKNIEMFPNAEVFVFTRWGKLVFNSKNLSANPWNGTFKGKALPTDSYHYVLHLNDGSKPRSGAISIIR